MGKIEGGHGQGHGTGLPNDVDWADAEVEMLAYCHADAEAASGLYRAPHLGRWPGGGPMARARHWLRERVLWPVYDHWNWWRSKPASDRALDATAGFFLAAYVALMVVAVRMFMGPA